LEDALGGDSRGASGMMMISDAAEMPNGDHATSSICLDLLQRYSYVLTEVFEM
jgi:hypothetical protein